MLKTPENDENSADLPLTDVAFVRERASNAAVVELTIAAAFWGFGFVAAVWALRFFGPLGVTGWRFAVASVVGALFLLFTPHLRRQVNFGEFLLAFWPGVFLAGTLLLQTWGLKYTTATKSGFITILYVLIVPLMDTLISKRRLPKYHFVYAAIALFGVALICDLPQVLLSGGAGIEEKSRWNFGDWLTLGCAVAASLQIFWFGLIQKRITSSFNFNIYQSFWAGIVPLSLALFFEPFPTTFPKNEPLIGIAMLAFGSTMIAFALQVRAQKTISPSLASLLFLLESPFAALFAFILLGERFTLQGVLGACIILGALAASVALGRKPPVSAGV